MAAAFLNFRLAAAVRGRTTHVVFKVMNAPNVNGVSLEAQGFAKAYHMMKPRTDDVLLLGRVAAIPRASILSGMLKNIHVWRNLEDGAVYVLSGPTYYYNVRCWVKRSSSDDMDAPKLVHSSTLLRGGWDALLKQSVYYDQRIPEASWRFKYFFTTAQLHAAVCTTSSAATPLGFFCGSFLKLAHAMHTCTDVSGSGVKLSRLRKGTGLRKSLPAYVKRHIHSFMDPSRSSAELHAHRGHLRMRLHRQVPQQPRIGASPAASTGVICALGLLCAYTSQRCNRRACISSVVN